MFGRQPTLNNCCTEFSARLHVANCDRARRLVDHRENRFAYYQALAEIKSFFFATNFDLIYFRWELNS